jgi:hypothetical protein
VWETVRCCQFVSYIAPNFRITDERWTEKYLERSGRLIETQFLHLPQGTEGAHENISVSRCRFQISNQGCAKCESRVLPLCHPLGTASSANGNEPSRSIIISWLRSSFQQKDYAPRSCCYIGSCFLTEGRQIDAAEGKATVADVQAHFDILVTTSTRIAISPIVKLRLGQLYSLPVLRRSNWWN